jgi:peptidoglycan/LPS O-acetylase OafA/YrhL
MPGDSLRPASPAGSTRLRYESLDHWRGVACLLVIVYHSTMMYSLLVQHHEPVGRLDAAIEWLIAQTHSFSVGVTLFFVISGYCIAAAADSARHKGGGVGQYFFRRFRRIYPPFWTVLLLSVTFFLLTDYWPRGGLLSHEPWAQPRPFWYSPTQWFGNITLTETWRHHLFGSPRAHFPGQAWTLCYEEQFYLLTGLLVAFVPRAFFAGISGITLATIGTVWLGKSLPFPIDGFFFDGSWLLFAAGVAVYYRVNYATAWRSRLIDLLLFATIPIFWFYDVPPNGAAIGFTFAALLPYLYRFDRQTASSPIVRPLRVCGQMCYSLYLVHQLPVRATSTALYAMGFSSGASTLFVTVPACIGVSVALGWLFHISVERRFLNTAHPRTATERQPAVAISVPAFEP